MRPRWKLLAALAVTSAAVPVVAVAATASDYAGPHPDGTSVATYGWRITPAGQQLPLGEKPFGSALSPDGKYLAVSNDGTNVQSLSLVDVADRKTVQRIDLPRPEALFIGLAWSPDGSTLYAAAGGNDKIRVYRRSGDQLTEDTPITMPKGSFPAGLTLSADGHLLYVADNGKGAMSAIDTTSGAVLGTVTTGANPFTVGLTADGATAYVSNWGTNTLSVVDTATMKVRKTLTVGSHPTSIVRDPASGLQYVAVTDDDSVAVIDPKTDTIVRRISLAPYTNAPVGTSPQGMAITPDGRTLYVASRTRWRD
jgi:YVTN family beta-propeller protein